MAQNRESGLAGSNGLEIAYDLFGAEEHPPIVLIMGLGMPAVAWPIPLINGLVEAGYRVVRFDNRDIGYSTILKDAGKPNIAEVTLRNWLHLPQHVPYMLNDMAYDVLGLMDALEIESAHLVGVSMGGMVAQRFASRFPWRTRSLISMMSSSGRSGLPGAKREALRVLLERPKRGSSREMLIEHGVKTWRTIGSPAYPRTEDALRSLVSSCIDRGQPWSGVVRQQAAVLADGSRVSFLTGIRRPTLIIHGREDPLLPVECGVDTAAHIDGSNLTVIPGMGHDVPEALVPRITELIASHVREVDATA